MSTFSISKPAADLEGKILELKKLESGEAVDVGDEVARLEKRAQTPCAMPTRT